jgi:hypothetical protein
VPGHDGPVSDAAQLLSPAGQKLLDLLAGQEVTPGRALQLTEELRPHYPAGLIAAALTQQSLRCAAREKFSRADQMLFTRAGLEQASSELTAAHSARRFAGLATVADLCCGIGGNLIALVGAAGRVLAVDADLTSLLFGVRNVAVHHSAARVAAVCVDVQSLSIGGSARHPGAVQGVFIDPARRTGDRRLRAGDSRPPFGWCLRLAEQVPAVCIKAAPGLPRQLVPDGWEIEFAAVGRSLKEALVWSPAVASTARRATVLPAGCPQPGRDPGTALPGGCTLTAEPGPPVPVADPGEYLLDPNPAIGRAGLVAELARQHDAWQIDPMIAFLSLDRPASTPFARTLRVLDSMPWHERAVARRLRELGIGTADIRRRGLAGDVQQIHRRLKLQGDKSATVVITRHHGKPWCLICADVQHG